MARAKRKQTENFEWDEAARGFNFKTEETSEYGILEDHIIAHGFDFHLERTSGRAWKLLFLVLFSTWILVAIDYGAFDLNNASVLS